MKARKWLAAVTIPAVGLVACGSSSGSSIPRSAGDGITIHNFKFSPSPLTVKAGTALTVTNQDGTDHTFTADDHSFDTARFASGSKTVRLTKPGRITYHCEVHNFMTGVVNVTA